MNRNIWMNLAVAGTLVLTAASARAQGPGLHRGGPGFGGPMELMGFEGGHGKLVKGAPFSAKATSETTSTLQDGTVIHRTAQLSLFRDSQGRSRRELTASGFGPLATSGAPKTMVMISDPVAGAHYFLNSTNKTARKMAIRAKDPESQTNNAFHQRMEARESSEEAAGLLKKESLGTQVINGVSAEGTRVTKTIPAGKIGNDKPIQIVSERWFSPDLQIVVKSTHTDPQFGTTTYSVTNLQKTEPAATLFAVPSDYTVTAGGPRGHGRRGLGGPGADAPQPPPSNE
jgi:hypothetical protein